jgi:hypothetical protein
MNVDISVNGELVNYYFLPGSPMIVSHGEFTILNNTNSDQDFFIEKCWFVNDGAKDSLDLFHIYHDDESISNPFGVKSESRFDFRITFPFQSAVSGNAKYSLLIRVKCNDKIFEAESGIAVFEERSK